MVTEENRQKTLNQISKLLISCRTDKSIMEELKIPFATYYRYKQQLNDEVLEQIKGQRKEDLALSIEMKEARLKSILEPLLVRLNDSNRISNRDMATLASICKDVVFQLGELEQFRYEIVYHNKKELPGQPALTEDSESDQDDGMDYDSETNAYVHSRSTDANPIV